MVGYLSRHCFVLNAIHLDDQLRRMAVEIRDVIADDLLALKSPGERAEVRPKRPFMRRLKVPEPSSVGNEVPIVWKGHGCLLVIRGPLSEGKCD